MKHLTDSLLADGTKVSAIAGDGSGLLYRGPFVYRRSASGDLSLESAACSAGRLTASGALLHVTDHLGSVRAVIGGKDGAVYAADDHSPYGTVSSILAAGSAPEPPSGVTLRDGFTGQESQAPDFGIPYVDFGARLYSPALRRWLTPDPLSEKYYGVSPYAYCAGDPINTVVYGGLAWKPLYYHGEYVGYEWVSDDEAYENGQLKDGYYEQAIFFTNTGNKGTFNKDSKFNIGTSTALVYLADGSIVVYDACTYPSDLDKFPTMPEGLYEAKVGKHKGSYDALRLSEMGTDNFYANRIDLGYENPAFSDGRTYAQGINIHRAGNDNLTGGNKTRIYVSQGCLLISRTEWNSFIGHFANKSQRNNVVSVTLSRNVSTAVRYLIAPPIDISIKR